MEFPSPTVKLPDCQMNWDFLKNKIISIGNREKTGPGVALSFGKTTVAFAGAANSNTVNVDHNLGRTPIAVVATSNTGFGIFYQTLNFTSTQFQLIGAYPFGVLTQNADATWIAIG